MKRSCDAQHPVVDPTVLRNLRLELEPDPDSCNAFVNDYLNLLPQRIVRLHQALENFDPEAAMDAVLSLKTSSKMVGAVCLGILADELETTLKTVSADWANMAERIPRAYSTLLEQIDRCGDQTATCLTAGLAA